MGRSRWAGLGRLGAIAVEPMVIQGDELRRRGTSYFSARNSTVSSQAVSGNVAILGNSTETLSGIGRSPPSNLPDKAIAPLKLS